jgi:hypothetical protein
VKELLLYESIQKVYDPLESQEWFPCTNPQGDVIACSLNIRLLIKNPITSNRRPNGKDAANVTVFVYERYAVRGFWNITTGVVLDVKSEYLHKTEYLDVRSESKGLFSLALGS